MIKSFFKELVNGKGTEGRLVKVVFSSLLVSFLILSVLYFTKFKDIPGFVQDYGFFLFFGIIIYSIIAGVIYQVRAFGQFPCMSGMMIGMTLGMISGFIPGYIVATTNGMFMGSVVGMTFGIFVGILSGARCCGVMGFLEGIMSGFMGGLMGAMTAFMLFNDNLRIATVIVSLISCVILIALNYMIYLESKQLEIVSKKNSLMFTVVFSFISVVITTWIMVYGPRSGAFG